LECKEDKGGVESNVDQLPIVYFLCNGKKGWKGEIVSKKKDRGKCIRFFLNRNGNRMEK